MTALNVIDQSRDTVSPTLAGDADDSWAHCA